jgi:hypothetical protein
MPESPSASPYGRGDDNPFLKSSSRRARFEMDYLSESQWYSDYPHHLTVEYLDEVFNMEKRGIRSCQYMTLWDDEDFTKAATYVSMNSLYSDVYQDKVGIKGLSGLSTIPLLC